MPSRRVDFFPLRIEKGPAMIASDPGWMYDRAVEMLNKHQRDVRTYLGAHCLLGAKITEGLWQLHGFVLDEPSKTFTVESHYISPKNADNNLVARRVDGTNADAACEGIVLSESHVHHTNLASGLALPQLFPGNAYYQFEERTRRLDPNRKSGKDFLTYRNVLNNILLEFAEDYGHSMHHPALQELAEDVICEAHGFARDAYVEIA